MNIDRILLCLTLYFVFGALPSIAQWQDITPDNNSENLYGVDFLDEQLGYAVGWTSQAVILKTEDGGQNWLKIEPPQSFIFGIEVQNENDVFVTGYSFQHQCGMLYRSTSKGNKWEQVIFDGQQNPFTFGFYNYEAVDENTALMSGYQGLIAKTTDGGSTWYKTDNGGSADCFRVLKMVDDKLGFAACGEGQDFQYINKLYRTTDGGESWHVNLERSTSNFFGHLDFVNSTTGYFFGAYNGKMAVMKTTDAGDNWTESYLGAEGNFLLCGSFADEMNGYAVGSGGITIKTTDGGVTWSEIPKVTSEALLWVDFPKAETGYAVGVNGTILKYNSATGVEEKLPIDGLKSYPNPFFNDTEIKFEISVEAEVKLEVFDSSGDLVEILVDARHGKGSHSVVFDGMNKPAGLYFYKIEINDKIKTGKIFLIK